MSLTNATLHGLAFAGTLIVGSGLFGALVYASRPAQAAHEPPLKDMITMEAALARKSVKQKQPVKELKTPEPPAKPEGVSRDENKPVEPKKDDKKPARKPDERYDISRYLRPSPDDSQSGKPAAADGQFDGSEKGFAPLNTGDPYWANLVADFRQVWELPAVLKVSGTPVGCFHIAPDGKIVNTRFDTPSGDETLDDSVQRALKATQKARNDKPQPVPTTQLGAIRKWVCFRFTP